MKIRTSLPIILSVVTVIALSAVATGAYAQQLPLFRTGDMYVRYVNFFVYAGAPVLPTTFLQQGFVQFPAIRGEGIAFDVAGNLYVGAGGKGAVGGLKIYPRDFDFDSPQPIGEFELPGGEPPVRAMNIALRPPDQVFACNPIRPDAELLVFGTAVLESPTLDHRWAIPLTTGGECRGIAFDKHGQLWVTSYLRLIRLTVDAQGKPIESASFSPGGNPFALAFQPATDRLFYTAINSNEFAVLDPTNPGERIATITNVCDNANNSPRAIAFDTLGNLYVGCANHDGATTAIVAFPARLLGVSLQGSIDSANLSGLVKWEEPALGKGGVYIAFKPSSPSGSVIPTVSSWGLIVLALMLALGAKLYFGRRHPEATE